MLTEGRRERTFCALNVSYKFNSLFSVPNNPFQITVTQKTVINLKMRAILRLLPSAATVPLNGFHNFRKPLQSALLEDGGPHQFLKGSRKQCLEPIAGFSEQLLIQMVDSQASQFG